MYCGSSRTVNVDASTEPFLEREGGVLVNPECEPFCGTWAGPLNLVCTLPDPTKPSLVECLVCGFGGRLPEGLLGTATASLSDVGGYFADLAYVEAASVEAFRVLSHELRHHRAPKKLVRAAQRSARDEVRHARATCALARRYCATPQAPRVEKRPLRSLETIALDNAIEGCVRETYGALIAMWQAEHAGDARVRAAAARIARDEIRHAALGWQIASWLNGRLDRAARHRVEDTRRKAVSALAQVVKAEPRSDVQRIAGLPSLGVAQRLVDQLATIRSLPFVPEGSSTTKPEPG
jgi:hypothetical protein